MANTNKITFEVFRFNPIKDKDFYFQSFEVPKTIGMTVLSGLLYIRENLDQTLSFRSACREAVCGSCAMHINGRYLLACNTQIESLDGQVIKVRPLTHIPIKKDLVVDLAPFFDKFKKIEPYLKPAKPYPEKEFIQSIEERSRIDLLVDCILCGACSASCPESGTDKDFLGPAIIQRQARFIFDSRDGAADERLVLIRGDHGVYQCHNAYNCGIACPKDIDPTKTMSRAKRQAVYSAVKKILTP